MDPLNFDSTQQALAPQDDPVIRQQSATGPGLQVAFGPGSNAPRIDPQARQTTVPDSGLGLNFGAALAPKADARTQQALSFGAGQAEKQGMALALTPQGQKKLTEMKTRGALYQPAANGYMDLFVTADQMPTEEQQDKINRLQRLEESLMRQQVLPAQMQVDAVGTRAAVQRLRSELDNDTRKLRLHKERLEFAKADAASDKLERDERAQRVLDKLDQLDDGALKRALIENKGTDLHPESTNLDIMQLLATRRKLNLSVGPDGAALSPEERAQRLNGVLDGMSMAELDATHNHIKETGPLAYRRREVGAQLATAGTAPPEQIAREVDADRKHNAAAAQLRARVGGLDPNENEVLAAIVRKKDLYTKSGKTPGQIAFDDARIAELSDMKLRIFQERATSMGEAGIVVPTELVADTHMRISEATRLVANATTPKERIEAGKLLQDAEKQAREQLNSLVEAYGADEGSKTALNNYFATGAVGSAADATALFAATTARGQTGLSGYGYAFDIQTATGQTQRTIIPLSNPTATATQVLQPQFEEAVRSAEIAGKPELKVAYAELEKKRKTERRPTGLLDLEREEATIRRGYASLTREQKQAARIAYRDTSLQNVLIASLNKHLGNDAASKTLQDKMIDTGPSGSGFRAAFTQVDAATKLRVIDPGAVVRALNAAGRADVIDKVVADLASAETRTRLSTQLAPRNMREKAMFAMLHGNDSYVQVGAEGVRNVGAQNHRIYMEGRVINPLIDALKRDVQVETVRAAKARRLEMGTVGEFGSAVQLNQSIEQATEQIDGIVSESRALRNSVLGLDGAQRGGN